MFNDEDLTLGMTDGHAIQQELVLLLFADGGRTIGLNGFIAPKVEAAIVFVLAWPETAAPSSKNMVTPGASSGDSPWSSPAQSITGCFATAARTAGLRAAAGR
ncbi:hypothetical protein [Amycolatopsis sp.]|uniref:hypothetical protein n=1 Tax=Amycolatopsis sp. TaxID=37632 RepID=UPI002DFABB70|nr:hypothetical protein [Amycolatopsis sp.]